MNSRNIRNSGASMIARTIEISAITGQHRKQHRGSALANQARNRRQLIAVGQPLACPPPDPFTSALNTWRQSNVDVDHLIEVDVRPHDCRR